MTDQEQQPPPLLCERGACVFIEVFIMRDCLYECLCEWVIWLLRNLVVVQEILGKIAWNGQNIDGIITTHTIFISYLS